jgi:hypothetical protein
MVLFQISPQAQRPKPNANFFKWHCYKLAYLPTDEIYKARNK